jgi:hypothetical protein
MVQTIPEHAGLNTPSRSVAIRRGGVQENAMGALLYFAFVTIGGLLAVAVGYVVEPMMSMTASLTVFLALFFANFVVSWVAVVVVMNGPHKDMNGRETKADIAKAGQEAMAAKGLIRADAVGASISTAPNPGRTRMSPI